MGIIGRHRPRPRHRRHRQAIKQRPEPGGILGSIIIGVLGAFVGALLATASASPFAESFPPEEFFDLSVWISAIIGALIVLVRLQAARRPRRRRTR